MLEMYCTQFGEFFTGSFLYEFDAFLIWLSQFFFRPEMLSYEKSLSYIFPFLLQEPMQRRERKSRIYNCRPLAEERRNCQHMQECGIPPPPFHSGLPWMDGPKERSRKEPDSFSLFVSSRFMKIAKKRRNGLLANEGRRLVLANK